ncbi:phosphatidate cytidylyltransferase [Arthrobacter cryoconiti]|uniref:Phosphatidate cytidylyltransferase n=1 Tax=Arthrobacter cryoconiti TaxID=748907 RepID=A0ABV8R3X4_9MICC
MPATADSLGDDPSTPNPAPDPSMEPPAYQFPTRKARRVAELTGMIPIVAPAPDHSEQAARGEVAREETVSGIESGVGSKASQPVLSVAGTARVTKSWASVGAEPSIPVPAGPVAVLPDIAMVAKPKNRTPKAGRDLPAAISVGLSLLVVVLASLLFFPLAFVVVATVFAAVGVWEVARATASKGILVPMTPVMVGALAMPASAYFAGSEGLLFALVASCGATLLWRSLDPEPGAVKSILAGMFVLMWIPFLLGFVFLMLRAEHGPTLGLTLDMSDINRGVLQVVIMLILVVANDTFGYLVGVLFGKHPMAPKISPKKSWEGFAGSMGGAMLVAIPATVFVLNEHWWVGLALAIGMVVSGTGGDFAESMVKRELGVKDMSNLLPGHGGVMDRLDSILFAAPVAYATFSVLGQF